MSDGTEVPVPGVISMDHTADLALEVTAANPEELLGRAAAGMFHLLLERRTGREDEARPLDLRAADPASLLRNWLRELLFWHDTEGFAPAAFEFRRLRFGEESESALEAVVHGGVEDAPPVREIKGVTLHGLVAEPRDDGWFARVVFDV